MLHTNSTFQELRELSLHFIQLKLKPYKRYFILNTPLNHRFSIILGERGVGKTTTLIQYLLNVAKQDPLSDQILYIQADHFLMRGKSLYEIAEEFCQLGGQVIAFDEIHKYPNWSMELKSIYDTFPDLKILASGSSALEIHKGSHDLVRRAVVYHIYGLSFREYIGLKYGIQLPTFAFHEIITHHTKLAHQVIEIFADKKMKILKLFREYMEYGYYPYFLEFKSIDEFKITVEQNIHTTLESDLVAIYPSLTGNSVKKIKQLVSYLAQSVPFTPNWQTIRKITDIADDRTIKTYFKYLEGASLISSLELATEKLKRLEGHEKIYLGNTNQIFAVASIHPNIGTLRETFFLASLRPGHQIAVTKSTDFLVDSSFYVEVGGKNKGSEQLKENKSGYLALDDIEYGVGRRIPLWLFGFLY